MVWAFGGGGTSLCLPQFPQNFRIFHNYRILDSYIFPSFNTLKILFNWFQVSTALIKKEVCVIVPRTNIFFLFSLQHLEYDMLWYGFICSYSSEFGQLLRFRNWEGPWNLRIWEAIFWRTHFFTLFSFSSLSGIPILHVLRLVPIETSHRDFSSAWLHLPA